MAAEVVGTAYVKIRGLTTQMGSDIQDGIDDGIEKSDIDSLTDKVEKSTAEGTGEGVEKGTRNADTDALIDKTEKSTEKGVGKGVGKGARDADTGGLETNIEKSTTVGVGKGVEKGGKDADTDPLKNAIKKAVSKGTINGMDDFNKVFKKKPLATRIFSRMFQKDIDRLERTITDRGYKVGKRFSEKFAAGFQRDRKKLAQKISGSMNKMLGMFTIPPIGWLAIFALPALGGALKIAGSYIGALIGQIGYLLTAIVGVSAALAGVGAAMVLTVIPMMLAFKAESPALDKFKESIAEQAEAWLEVGIATQEFLLPALDRAFGSLSRLIPQFTVFGSNIGRIIGRMAELSAAALTSERNLENWGVVFGSSQVIMQDFSGIVQGLSNMMPGFLAAVMPLSERLSASFAGGFDRFNEMINAGVESGGLADTLDTWYNRAELFGRALMNITRALWEIFKVGGDAVEPMFENLDTWAANLLEWTKSLEGNTVLQDFFGNAVEVAQEFNALMADIIGWIMMPIASGDTSGVIEFMQWMREDLLPIVKELASSITKDAAAALQGLAESFVALLTSLSESGALGNALTVFQSFFDLLNRLLEMPGFGKFLASFIGLMSALSAFNLVLGKLPIKLLSSVMGFLGTLISGTFMSAATAAFAGGSSTLGALGAGLIAVLGPIALVIAAVVALAGVAYLIYRNWDTISAWFKENVIPWYEEYIKPTFEKIQEIVGNVLKAIGDWWAKHGEAVIAGLMEMAKLVGGLLVAAFKLWWKVVKIALIPIGIIIKALMIIWENFGDEIMVVAKFIWGYVVQGFEKLWDILKNLIRFVTAVFEGDWSTAWAAIKDVAVGFLDYMLLLPKMIIDALALLGPFLLEFFTGVGENFWAWIVEATDNMTTSLGEMWNSVWTSIVDFVAAIPGHIEGAIAGMVDWIGTAASDAVTALGTFASEVWTWASEFITGLPEKFIGYITGWGAFGSAMMTAIVDGLKGAIGGLTSWGSDLMAAVKRAVYNATPGWLRDAMSWIVDQGSKPLTAAAAGFGLLSDINDTIWRNVGSGVSSAWGWASGRDDNKRSFAPGGSPAFAGGIPSSGSSQMNLVVQIGDRDITDIVDARFSDDMGELAHGLFVRRP